MKERVLLGLILSLVALSVMVDFVSTILSVFSDALLLGGAVYLGWRLLRGQRSRLGAMQAENGRLQEENRRLRRGAPVMIGGQQ